MLWLELTGHEARPQHERGAAFNLSPEAWRQRLMKLRRLVLRCFEQLAARPLLDPADATGEVRH